ncbi:MAG: hypothetical protein IKU52_04225 [Clostridia bacterium]|nr:hypothetical protein [Clostridia bacterium]
MKTLYTAFKGKNNTSYQLVTAINGESLLLTNSFQGIERDIADLCSNYDAVVMFGVDKTLVNCIRIEGCAEHNGETIYSIYDIKLIAQKGSQAKITHNISYNPTKYFCNFAYWHMLHKVPNTVFIHIPSIGGMTPDFMNLLIDFFRD